MTPLLPLREKYNDLTQHSKDRENESIPKPTHSVSDFPDSPELAKAATREWEKYHLHRKSREQEKDFRNRYALAMHSYVDAVDLLMGRNDYEYDEGFEFETLTRVEDE